MITVGGREIFVVELTHRIPGADKLARFSGAEPGQIFVFPGFVREGIPLGRESGGTHHIALPREDKEINGGIGLAALGAEAVFVEVFPGGIRKIIGEAVPAGAGVGGVPLFAAGGVCDHSGIAMDVEGRELGGFRFLRLLRVTGRHDQQHGKKQKQAQCFFHAQSPLDIIIVP